MRRFDYIFYDLDGTLSESGPGITKAVQYALDSIGIHEPDLKKLEDFVGPPLMVSFHRYYGQDEESCIRLIDKFHEYYNDNGVYDTRLYDGVDRMLQRQTAAGQHLSIASSKPYSMVCKVLEHLGIERYFESVTGSSDHDEGSVNGNDGDHKKLMLERAMHSLYEKCRVASDVPISFETFKKKSVMVGDRNIIGGRGNGITTAGAAYGYGGRRELEEAGADFIADDTSSLNRFLQS